MSELLTGVTALTAGACAVTAGVFFAFSSFVMRAFGQVPWATAVTAMQSINAAAIPSSFFLLAYATVLPCLALAGWAVASFEQPAAPFVLAGSAFYLVGSMGVTALAHLPRNDELARVDPQSAEASAAWARYHPGWTTWNHVRAAGALAAAVALIGALLIG